MKNEDMRLKALYTELYDNSHASAELKGKVRNMTQGKKTVRKSIKVMAILAAAAIALVGGTIVTTASHKNYVGQYVTAYIDGEEIQARYGVWDTIGTHLIECEKNGKTYSAYVEGEFDKDTMTIYFRDMGDYMIASTDPNQQLNLYEDIDKALHAKIEGDMLYTDTSYMYMDVETPDDPEEYAQLLRHQTPYMNSMSLTLDEKDGVKDGVMHHSSKESSAYIITPEGFLVEGLRSKGSFFDDDYSKTMWGLIWGEETWESFQEYENAYRDSDGNLVIE